MRAIRTIIAICALSAAAALAPAAAGAATFTVNQTSDFADTSLDGLCDTAPASGLQCSLRAALEESNSAPGLDSIAFDGTPFNGQVGDLISLGVALPQITSPVHIDAGNCGSASSPRPCAGIDANGLAGLTGEANGIGVRGLAIYDAGTALDWKADALDLSNTWLGVDLSAAAGPAVSNTVGISLEGDTAAIGGTEAADRNVISNSSDTGLRIPSGDNNSVEGSYFGVLPDGVTAAANGFGGPGGDNVEIVGVAAAGAPTGNVIGASIGGSAQSSAACDEGCNLIAAADADGIDLGGDGGGESPAGRTQVKGNLIGIAADGTRALPNSGAGVEVGDAAEVTVGGPLPGDRNHFYGGAAGVSEGTGAANLLVRGNSFGLAGTDSGAPLVGGIATPSPSPAAVLRSNMGEPAVFTRNRISAAAAAAAALQASGPGAVLTGNVLGIGGGGEDLPAAQVGILVTADDVTVGGAASGDGNTIANATVAGILIAGADRTEVKGNLIGTDANGAGGYGNASGIRVATGGDSALGNRVGGDLPREGNEISNSTGTAIEISGDGNDGNLLAGNTGRANGGIFIDLSPISGAGVGPTAANAAIAAPIVDTGGTTESISGTAGAGATVRVYLSAGVAFGAVPGRVDGLVGIATASPTGDWELTCPSPGCDAPVPAGKLLTATQSDAAGDTSELADAVGYTDVTPPQTTITAGPKGPTRKRRARFVFTSREPGSAFQCRLDQKPWRLCRSPRTYRRLKAGRHYFSVKATDSGGNTDLSPVGRSFRILERKRR